MKLFHTSEICANTHIAHTWPRIDPWAFRSFGISKEVGNCLLSKFMKDCNHKIKDTVQLLIQKQFYKQESISEAISHNNPFKKKMVAMIIMMSALVN